MQPEVFAHAVYSALSDQMLNPQLLTDDFHYTMIGGGLHQIWWLLRAVSFGGEFYPPKSLPIRGEVGGGSEPHPEAPTFLINSGKDDTMLTLHHPNQ